MREKQISIIVPCYNEEDVVRDTWKRISAVMQNKLAHPYEILFVNDGSRDGTLEILKELANENEHVRILSFSRNFGHEAATTAGLHHCRGELAFLVDADLQDPPELFPEMLQLMERENCDAVYGVRKHRSGESFLKRLTSRLFYRFYNWLSDVKFPVDTGDFRLINRKIIDEFIQLKEKGKYVRGLLTWVGFKQLPFYYEREERQGGTSKYNYRKLMKLAVDVIFSFTKKPLQLATWLGIGCIFVALSLIVYTLVSRVVAPLKGWASMMTVIIFFGGVQLVTIGVIGHYVGYIFDEIKGRPEYIIEETIGEDGKDPEKQAL